MPNLQSNQRDARARGDTRECDLRWTMVMVMVNETMVDEKKSKRGNGRSELSIGGDTDTPSFNIQFQQ
jgi:hypothetical protein